MADRLDEIRSRTDAATPGPWTIFHRASGPFLAGQGRAIGPSAPNPANDDTAFILNARADVPWLLGRVAKLRACRDELGHQNTELGEVILRQRARLDTVRALHSPIDLRRAAPGTEDLLPGIWRRICRGCSDIDVVEEIDYNGLIDSSDGVPWPCPTIRALDDESAKDGAK